MGTVWIVLGALGAAILLFAFIFAPGRAGKKKRAPFDGRNIAHRGLFEADQSVPENSLAAFSRAVEAGYGVELDVQLSRDGEVVVFHDDDLRRVCGVERRVDELDLSELRELSLCETDERIPLFSEVLGVLGGKVPVIVELKNGKRNGELCEKTLALLREYGGEYCIESFNPFIVAWFRFHAPSVLRGVLSQPPADFAEANMAGAVGALLGSCAFNFAARPHFIAYRIGRKPFPVRFSESLGAMKVAWTAHDEVAERDFDTVIFEHYRPKVKFK